MNRSSRQKTEKETVALNDTLSQKVLIEQFIEEQQNTNSVQVNIKHSPG